MEQARAQAQQILADATRRAEAERSARGRIVCEMLATGESRALVAQRLGVSAGELRALVDAAGTTTHGNTAGLPGSG